MLEGASARLQADQASVVVALATQQTTNQLGRVSAITQKAHLLPTFAGISGQLTAELALPERFKLFPPVHAALSPRLLNVRTRQTALPQLFADAQRAVARAGTVGNEAFEVSGFGQQTLFRQPVER